MDKYQIDFTTNMDTRTAIERSGLTKHKRQGLVSIISESFGIYFTDHNHSGGIGHVRPGPPLAHVKLYLNLWTDKWTTRLCGWWPLYWIIPLIGSYSIVHSSFPRSDYTYHRMVYKREQCALRNKVINGFLLDLLFKVTRTLSTSVNSWI